MVDPSVTGLQARTAWWRIQANAIPVARCLDGGSRGADALREELGEGNEGVGIPSPVGWLGGAAGVGAGYGEGIIAASSVVFAVADESVYRSIRKGGLRLQRRRYSAETYEEIRPDVGCGHCAGWGHIESKCDRANARCGWCAGRHTTKEHRCPVE